jgi:predicted membrane-bound spermidine synthase
MSLYTVAFLGMAPVGSLFAGWFGERLGAPDTVLLAGVVTLLGAVWFLRELPRLRQAVRPVYVRLGILPEVAEGLRVSAEMSRPPKE